MTLQNIRRYYETPIRDICAAENLEVLGANQLAAGGDAISEWVQLDLTFSTTTTPGLCGNLELIKGVFVIGYYTMKGIGAGQSQDIMTQFMSALNGLTVRPAARTYGVLGTLGPIVGPDFTALTDTPFFYTSISSNITANWEAP